MVKKKSKFPKLTRDQARAVKNAADQLTKADTLYDQGSGVIDRIKKKKVNPLTIEEQQQLHWSVYTGIINGQINARTGLALLDAGPLGALRLIEQRERDNGRRKKTRVKTG